MKLKNPMLVVKDIDKSVEFYKQIFSLHVIMDFGANKTLTGGLTLQTEDTYKDFIGREIQFGGNDAEIYFEESDFDGFIEKLKGFDVEYMKVVCRRFLDSGMTPEEVAKRMDVPMKFINACTRS